MLESDLIILPRQWKNTYRYSFFFFSDKPYNAPQIYTYKRKTEDIILNDYIFKEPAFLILLKLHFSAISAPE